MSVFALGLNHTTASVDLRGRFAFSAEQLAPTLQGFRDRIRRPDGAPENPDNRGLPAARRPFDVVIVVIRE